MVTSMLQQVKALELIRGLRAEIDEAADRLRVIDEIGTFDEPASPAALKHERRLDLLRDAEADLQRRQHRARDHVAETQARIAAARSEPRRRQGDPGRRRGDRLAHAQREPRRNRGPRTGGRLRADVLYSTCCVRCRARP